MLLALVAAVAGCGFSVQARAAKPQNAGHAELADHMPEGYRAKRHHGRLPSEIEIGLRIVFKSRDVHGAEEYARGVYDPQHDLYGKFLTPDEYNRRFGPDKAAVKVASDHLAAHGLKLERMHGHVMHVSGKAEQIEQAMGTELHLYGHGPDGAVHGPSETPRMPKAAQVQAVHGLATPPRRKTHRAYLADRTSLRSGPYTGQGIRKAYEVPDKATGAGQVMGLLELDSYDPKDIAGYCKANKLREVPLNNVLLGGYNGAIMDPGAQGEVTLDIELMNAIAPGAKEMRVYMASQQNNGFFDILNEIANPTQGDKALVKTISCSWGAPEDQMSTADIQAESVLYRQMAIQGQSFFVASGDSGARDDGRTLGTDDPASQVYTVAVGGTSLYTNADGSYAKESAWLDGGGGISRYWGIPTWQKAAYAADSRASVRRRNVPDVSMAADPATGHSVLVAGQWQTVGGTSCAAPLWAAVWALAAEAREEAKLAPLGFFNPVFYQLMASPQGKGVVHDILDNTTNGYYPSVPGRDNATGWGSPRVGPLLQALSAK